MRLSVIDAGNFKLDGGSMFGVVPKSIWSKLIPADENNMCNFKMRCLLVEYGNRLVLIDTGMGAKQPEKWQNYYYRNGDGELKKSINKAGYSVSEVTDVLLSHLHFDHCGGAVEWNADKTFYQPAFSNARYWTHSAHYKSTVIPNPREKATFLKENIEPLAQAGQLFFIDRTDPGLGGNFEFLLADGHTEKMIMPLISVNGKKVLFSADTIPTAAHVHVPYVMSYDIEPLTTMSEKETLLERIVKDHIVVVFDHDVMYESAVIVKTEKGYRAESPGTLESFL